jgi:hypothetical protein
MAWTKGGESDHELVVLGIDRLRADLRNRLHGDPDFSSGAIAYGFGQSGFRSRGSLADILGNGVAAWHSDVDGLKYLTRKTNMALKKQELEKALRGEGCLGKAHDDEPVFILRAQDALAAECVERWAIRARSVGVNNDKVQEAFSIAEEMLQWHNRKIPD